MEEEKKKDWIRIDPHVHSLGASLCSDVDCKEIVEEKKRLGYQGAILTNHCQSWYYPEEEHADFMRRLVSEYERGAQYAAERDFKLWLGIEVTLDEPHYADWLLYGTTKEFLLSSPCLYKLTQKELFELCEANGILMVQAHAFRTGHSPCNPAYMHGIEINCNRRDLGNVGKVEAFAKEHALYVTCGVDYHHIMHFYYGGMFVPKECDSSVDFAEYIKRSGETHVFMQGDEMKYDFTKRKK